MEIAPETPAFVNGDSNRLCQVLNNFASNAIKFTKQGKALLDVRPVNTHDGKVFVRFAITDTGIGLTPEQVGRLFVPFTQGDVSTTRKYGGTGLGLAISKQLVELMGGTIGVESKEGEGSSFWFILPLETSTAALHPTQKSAGIAERNCAVEGIGEIIQDVRRTTSSRRGIRILLAEDNATNRLVALSQLHKLGYEAEAVVNGAEALAALDRGEFHLVLMDCEMPVMDGYEATRRIRQSRHSHIAVIAMTAHTMSKNWAECMAAGMSDFLSKPVDNHRLAEILARWTGMRQLPADLPGECPCKHGAPPTCPHFGSDRKLVPPSSCNTRPSDGSTFSPSNSVPC